MKNQSEELLHFIWQFLFFDRATLYTAQGETLELLSQGMLNHDSGPDFFNARIRINQQEWAGNIEIHWNSSEWHQHKHHEDPAYNNVILHVVFNHDRDARKQNGNFVPVLELKSRIQSTMLNRYHAIMKSRNYIPCEKLLPEVSKMDGKSLFFQKLLIERLMMKTESIRKVLQDNGWNWEDAFYRFMARAFGFKVNAEPFFQLASITPLSILSKHKSQIFQIEALLLGQAGLLSDQYNDEYMQQLLKEYRFLQSKFSLIPMMPHMWKFGRMRPPNFPTVRIVQFAALIHYSSALFSHMIEIKKYDEAMNWLMQPVSEYWQYRYQPDGLPSRKRNQIGELSAQSLILNVTVPFMFLYGRERNIEQLCDRAIDMLQQIPSEQNQIVKRFDLMGVKSNNAGDSQALLTLKSNYCDKRKCLHCIFGNQILVQNRE
ncbi:MAG: DUF2851 family protein [Candidatus Competibacteraceae bacterium]|nr:DUF2851 family protein [Candidatus Competibacteraceae bacterium]